MSSELYDKFARIGQLSSLALKSSVNSNSSFCWHYSKMWMRSRMDFFLLSFLVVSVQPEDKISFQELNYLLWAYAIFFVARTQEIAKT